MIRAILRAPVDLLWNGGIGTFVKASSQSDAEADDRSNDTVRVDARELRCRVVGEGGNLGFTQEARVEFSRRGGRINTDFIDNSGGVNCSDREVNLKVLLGLAEERGTLDRSGRDILRMLRQVAPSRGSERRSNTKQGDQGKADVRQASAGCLDVERTTHMQKSAILSTRSTATVP